MIVVLVTMEPAGEPERVEPARPAVRLPDIPRTLPVPPKPAPAVEPPKHTQVEVARPRPSRPRPTFEVKNKVAIDRILDTRGLSTALSRFRGTAVGRGTGSGAGPGSADPSMPPSR